MQAKYSLFGKKKPKKPTKQKAWNHSGSASLEGTFSKKKEIKKNYDDGDDK